MFCGCSKPKKPRKGRPDLSAGSDFTLLSDIPECSGAEFSDEWCRRLPSYGQQNRSRTQSGYSHNSESQVYEELENVRSPVGQTGGHFGGHFAKHNYMYEQSRCHAAHCNANSEQQRIYPEEPQDYKCTPHVNQGFDSGIDTGSSPDSGHSLSRGARTVTVLEQYGSAPLLEVCERGSMSSLTGRPTKMLQSYRGQVKLSVYLNSGLLTLHVRQAKHLNSKWSTLPCPYVKVAIIPDEMNTTRCRSQSQADTERPRFDEKFSFEIGDEDFDKRLLVSLHSKHPNHNRSELLGCMSFGIHNMVRRKTHVHGWYYLLSEQVGCRKHLQAHNRRHLGAGVENHSCIISETASCSEFSEGPQQDIPPQSAVLHMVRGENGYGFTLSGGCPTKVLTVEPGSPADEEGMRVGDKVLSINYQDVSRSTADTVARIVRFHPEIEIEVQSPSAPTPTNWQDSDFLSSTPPPEEQPAQHSHQGTSTPLPSQSQRRIQIPSQSEHAIHNHGQSEHAVHNSGQSQTRLQAQSGTNQLQDMIQPQSHASQSRRRLQMGINGQDGYTQVNSQSRPRIQKEINQPNSVLHEALIHQTPPETYTFPDCHQLQQIIEEYS